ncbi:lipocalin family protein [Chitinophaga caeni]|nr:lipocalin family protein [Chitinophaga caeni]
MKHSAYIIFISLVLSACQQTKREAISSYPDSLIEYVDTIYTPPVAVTDTLQRDSIDLTLVPGRWWQPVPGKEEEQQGFHLMKGGKIKGLNMPALIYEKWEIVSDTLMLWSDMVSGEDTTRLIDTLLVRNVNDSVMVLFPHNAAAGYFEIYHREGAKGKKK